MSSTMAPPLFTNKRFRNLYLSLTATTELTQQDPTKTGEVEVEGETVDYDVPKTKKIFMEKELKKLINDDGLLKDSPTWYYLLLTSSSSTTTAISDGDGDDDDSDRCCGDDGKAPSTSMMIDMSDDVDTSQKKQPTTCCQIQILAYHKNKSSWKHTHQQLSKILLMMGSSKPNIHRGRSGDNIFHPPNPPQGGKWKHISLLPFQKWESEWEWEEVSMMAFKQRFKSLLRQQARTAASELIMVEEEESNPQHRPASLVFDQYFSSHSSHYADATNTNNLFEKSQEEEEEDLYQQLRGESKKISKKGRRLSPSSTTTTTKNHFPSHRQKPHQQPLVKLTTDLVARVSVEEFLETNPTVDQFLKFQKCKLLIDQISKHQQQQDLYLDQADSDCPPPSSEDFQYKWPSHLDKLQFPIIWQWFSQWHQYQPTQQSVEKLLQLRSNNDVGSPSPTRSNLVVGGGDDGEEEPVCKVEPSQEGEEIFEGKGGEDQSSPLLQSTSPKDDDKMVIEHLSGEEQLLQVQQQNNDSSNKHPRRRFKALVLYSEERGVGKTCLAKSFVYNNQNWIIHCRNKFNADQFKLVNEEEEAKLLLIDDFNFDPKIHHECFKALVTSEPTGIRDAYLNLQFKHGLPTIICTNDTKFYEYLLKSPDFQHDCMFSDVSGQYLGPPHTRQSHRRASSNNKPTICADPKTLARFQQLTKISIPPSEGAAKDEEEGEEEDDMFMSAYNNRPRRKRRNYQQLLLREAEAFLTGNPRHRNRRSIYEDDPQLQKRRRKIKNNSVLFP